MSEPMYQRCPVCRGTLRLDKPAVTNTGRTVWECPCAGAEFPGWSPVGVTVGQLERLVRHSVQRDALLAACEFAIKAILTNDPIAAVEQLRRTIALAQSGPAAGGEG